jgi:hypothetical protein
MDEGKARSAGVGHDDPVGNTRSRLVTAPQSPVPAPVHVPVGPPVAPRSPEDQGRGRVRERERAVLISDTPSLYAPSPAPTTAALVAKRKVGHLTSTAPRPLNGQPRPESGHPRARHACAAAKSLRLSQLGAQASRPTSNVRHQNTSATNATSQLRRDSRMSGSGSAMLQDGYARSFRAHDPFRLRVLEMRDPCTSGS